MLVHVKLYLLYLVIYYNIILQYNNKSNKSNDDAEKYAK